MPIMQYLSSLLILITLTCPVMCGYDVGCCTQSEDGLTRSQIATCCSHCSHQYQHEDAHEERIPPQRDRPCACSCLCGGAVVVESVSLPVLAVVWFVIDLWVSNPPESANTGTMWGDSYMHDRCPISGYALRIVECSLRS